MEENQRKRYCGRGMPREVKLVKITEKETSVLSSTDKQVHWWHGTAELLGLISRRRKKGVGPEPADKHLAKRLATRANECKSSPHVL